MESDAAKFFEGSSEQLVKEFEFKGQKGRVYEYPAKREVPRSYVLCWFNPPKQRLSISVDQNPVHEFSPNDLIDLLKAMTSATGIPALIDPFPEPVPGLLP